MIDLNSLLHFSHIHCIAICSALVPINLLATLQTLLLLGLNCPLSSIWGSAAIATTAAMIMVLHVLSWFVIGVVMLPTFILLALGAVCLSINGWAVSHPQSLKKLIEGVTHWSKRSLQLVFQGVGA
ncbi:hypothetical protein [Leptodesmis sp.]|uniref:hypothetical protein n=1 Tax=Leptodesmis sp. TaxID=3100501 RepID=UPI0040535170